MTTLNGIDISGFQSMATLDSWLPKIDFAIVKATEGAHTRMATHAEQVAALRKAGKLVAHYHYAWPENGGKNDAANFLGFCGAVKGDIVALDFEPFNSKSSPTVWAQYIVDFANAVHAKLGTYPALYCEDYHLGILSSHWSASQASFIRANLPLWKAGYNNAYEHLSAPPAFKGNTYGWPCITFWQWTDQPIDRDVFYGSKATWEALAVGHPTPATPAPAPAPAPAPKPAPAPAPAPTKVSVSLHTDAIAAVPKGHTVNLTATVNPPSAAGTVLFEWLNGTVWDGFGGNKAVPSSGKVAIANVPYATVQYRAVFTPTDKTKFAAATSATATVRVVDLGALADEVAKKSTPPSTTTTP